MCPKHIAKRQAPKFCEGHISSKMVIFTGQRVLLKGVLNALRQAKEVGASNAVAPFGGD